MRPIVALLLVLLVAAPAALAQEPLDRRAYLRGAVATQNATRGTLRVLGDAFTCDEARFVSYRRGNLDPENIDQWYVASQLWADAELLHAAPADFDVAEARCHLDKGFLFLDRLWDHERGGYFPRSNPTGTLVSRDQDRYADDNSLGGLALLAALEATGDPAQQRRYLHAARREADFMLQSGLWDDTFGGGFWWNTSRGGTEEGKPAQTNAIAALFFARLHAATGDPLYAEWAARTLIWMDTILFDSSRSLYRWSIGYQDRSTPNGSILSSRYFNYDQGIAIEAQLATADLDGDPARAVRARAVGEALHRDFWSAERGAYNLEAGVEQVFAHYAAWSSLGHLALFDLDGDPRWLDYARANTTALDTVLRRPDGAYATRHSQCVDRQSSGCASGSAWNIDDSRDGAAQAWMQHLQTALAKRLQLAPVRGARDEPATRRWLNITSG